MRYIVIAYETGENMEAAAYMECRRKWRQREQYRRKRRLYFLKQRLCGAVLIILADGDATAAAFLIPIGLFLIFPKEMCITNKLYWQEGRRRGRSGRA